MPKEDKRSKIAEFDGIEVRVLTRDEHCEPHVHAFHEGKGWELKIYFSFVSDQIGKAELEAGTRPKQKVVQKCMDSVFENLDECRHQFWEATRHRDLHCCLGNQYVMIDQDGSACGATAQTPGAMRVNTAQYLANDKSIEFTVQGQTKTFTGRCP